MDNLETVTAIVAAILYHKGGADDFNYSFRSAVADARDLIHIAAGSCDPSSPYFFRIGSVADYETRSAVE